MYAFEVDGHFAHPFAYLRRRCSGSSSEMLVRTSGDNVDHTRLRRRPAGLANETVCLETVLSGQASVRQVFQAFLQGRLSPRTVLSGSLRFLRVRSPCSRNKVRPQQTGGGVL